MITEFFIFSVVITSFAVRDGGIVMVDTYHKNRVAALRSIARTNPQHLQRLLRARYPGLNSYELPEYLFQVSQAA